MHRSLRVRREDLFTAIELPGFGSHRIGAALFLLVGIPLGLVLGFDSDFILAHQLVSPATAASLCALVLGVPYGAFTNTSGALSEAAYIRRTRSFWLRRRLLRRAAFLVAQTAGAADDLAATLQHPHVTVIPNAIETITPTPLNGEPRVLFTGRLAAEKGLLCLIDAWRVVAQRRPHARLTLAGEGGGHRPVETELRHAVATDAALTRSVTFTGWVDDVDELLATHDVFVLPSTTEGMSNSLLEACGRHRVVVASDIAPNRAVLGDEYPLLFRTGDPASLAYALDRAIGDDDCRRQVLGDIEGRVAAFSAGAIGDRLEALLFEATAK
jgi:glycosyltransferase involved in cell wall biosynthesis